MLSSDPENESVHEGTGSKRVRRTPSLSKSEANHQGRVGAHAPDVMKYKALFEATPFLSLEAANTYIRELLESSSPFFVGRFGSTELRAVIRHLNRNYRSPIKQAQALATKLEPPFFSRFDHRKLSRDSGFYPLSKDAVDRFAELIIESMPSLDLLGSWVRGENIFKKSLENAKVTKLGFLEPFFASNPWSEGLRDKRVMVVHPFRDSIVEQFAQNREKLFPRTNILPPFELIAVKAVQTLGAPDPRFKSWFDALNWMTEEVLRHDFDVAIVGCGAYGFPLSSTLKREGKKVIHLGGVTQLLFGIGGNRWDTLEDYAALANSSWTRPSSSEVPDGANRLGQNSYW